MAQRHAYGGQAVLEGVMIRGQRFIGLAVRRQNSQITTECKPINPIYSGRLRTIFFIRGFLVLIETLILGIQSLNRSATLALEDNLHPGQKEEISKWALPLSLAVALIIGIGIFFMIPLFAVRALDESISSSLVSNLIEGVLRLAMLVAYIWGVSLINDIKRVFAYHGAEHMTVHAHEAKLPLNIGNVRNFSTAHPRCGTAFLLTVMVVAIVVFSLLGRPPMLLTILSRVVFIPIIAAISYEVIRFSGFHQSTSIAKIISYPGLLLQKLTTRPPDDDQIEVAIRSMEITLAADKGRELVNPPQETESIIDTNPDQHG